VKGCDRETMSEGRMATPERDRLRAGFRWLAIIAGIAGALAAVVFVADTTKDAWDSATWLIAVLFAAVGAGVGWASIRATGWVIERFLFLGSPQKKIVILAGLLFALIGIFPPWIGTLPKLNMEWSYGYAPLIDPPSRVAVYKEFDVRASAGLELVQVHIDYGRLMVQWAVVIAVAGVGLFVVKK